MTNFCDLPIQEDDLHTVAEFLAPHYGETVGEKKLSIQEMVRSSKSAIISVEAGGAVAVRAGDKIRIFIGNHLIRCKDALTISKRKS